MSAILLLGMLFAQDLDVALSPVSKRSGTILDQVEDPAERRAFLDLYNDSDPLSRRSRVSGFVNKFSSSWLLAQVHEAGALASFELGDIPTGLFHARLSLELYPENAMLHSTLAAVYSNRGERRLAEEHARSALVYLERFVAPSNMTERSWNPVRERLRQTAVKILGADGDVPVVRPKDPDSAYAGSESCRSCHPSQFAAWAQTGMARMLRKATEQTVVGDFETEGYSQSGRFLARPGRTGRSLFFDLQRATGEWSRYLVEYVIGSKWQQAYATRAANGELHVLPIQYNLVEKSWINYWRMIDPPGSERAEISTFHRFREFTSYQKNCAPCHTSQMTNTSFREAGVNCEMCHGPGAAHAGGKPQKWSFQGIGNAQYVEVCAQCHAQSAIREPQGFPPRYKRRPYTEFSRKAFYRDGRFRETTFIVEAFERSACFRKGQAHCGSCHHPHPESPGANPTSLKFQDDPNRMCLQCHEEKYRGNSHIRHASGDATLCVSCHMPKIMNSLLFRARTHQIDDRPNGRMTVRFGASESPNACLDCHSDRDAHWAQDQLLTWSGNARTERSR